MMETIGQIDMKIQLPSNSFTWNDTNDNDTNNNIDAKEQTNNKLENTNKTKNKKNLTKTTYSSISIQLSVHIFKVIAEEILLKTSPHKIKHLNDEKAEICTHS